MASETTSRFLKGETSYKKIVRKVNLRDIPQPIFSYFSLLFLVEGLLSIYNSSS